MIRPLVVGMLLAVPALHAQDRAPALQVAAAVFPLPDSMRAGAKVLGYRGGKLVELRVGTNDMICLADSPADSTFQASCYHNSLEPFMARGRALREQGLKRQAIDSVRAAEVKSGALVIPRGPAALYSVFAKSDKFDPLEGPPAGATGLDVIYLPYATTASTGISSQPSDKSPWLMHPGEYRAHLMIPIRN